MPLNFDSTFQERDAHHVWGGEAGRAEQVDAREKGDAKKVKGGSREKRVRGVRRHVVDVISRCGA